MADGKAWDEGDWFDCKDSERLTHDNPTDAIVEYLDDSAIAGQPALEVIAAAAPLEVTAWRKKEGGEFLAEVDMYVETALDSFIENLAEENGDPDDGEIPGLSPKVRGQLLDLWRAHARLVFELAKVHSWSCERIGVRSFDAVQLEALLREGAPEWFEEIESNNP